MSYLVSVRGVPEADDGVAPSREQPRLICAAGQRIHAAAMARLARRLSAAIFKEPSSIQLFGRGLALCFGDFRRRQTMPLPQT